MAMAMGGSLASSIDADVFIACWREWSAEVKIFYVDSEPFCIVPIVELGASRRRGWRCEQKRRGGQRVSCHPRARNLIVPSGFSFCLTTGL